MSALEHKSGKRRVLGRYELHDELASGGMATVHLGRQIGLVGFSRPVAIKRLHEKYAKDQDFVAMFVDEARLASRVRHPNVVPTLDVIAANGELFLVMEYVHGESIARILRTIGPKNQRIPVPIAAAIAIDMLAGLHAAHEAKSERGEALGIVHRDVSPQNVLVSSEGKAHVFDFGIATASQRTYSTEDGSLKGKMPYMSPEQLNGEHIDRRADIWSAGVVVWEMLVARRLFTAPSSAGLVKFITEKDVAPPSAHGADGTLDQAIRGALTRDRDKRFQTAREMALAIEAATSIATPRAVGEWLASILGEDLDEQTRMVEDMERDASKERHSGQTRVEVMKITSDTGEKPALRGDDDDQTTTLAHNTSPTTPKMDFAPVTAPAPTMRQSPSTFPSESRHSFALPPAPGTSPSLVPAEPPPSRVGLIVSAIAIVVFLAGSAAVVWSIRTQQNAPPPPPTVVTVTVPAPPVPPPPPTTTTAAAAEPPPATTTAAEPPPTEKPTVASTGANTKKPPKPIPLPPTRPHTSTGAPTASTPRPEFGNSPW